MIYEIRTLRQTITLRSVGDFLRGRQWRRRRFNGFSTHRKHRCSRHLILIRIQLFRIIDEHINENVHREIYAHVIRAP